MSEPISQQAHEAAADRYAQACQVLAELVMTYRRNYAAAEAELLAALAGLEAQEIAPGIPAYLMRMEDALADAPPRLRVVDRVSDQALEAMDEDMAVAYLRGGGAEVEDDPEVCEFDPGPEVDDQGGMSEVPWITSDIDSAGDR